MRFAKLNIFMINERRNFFSAAIHDSRLESLLNASNLQLAIFWDFSPPHLLCKHNQNKFPFDVSFRWHALNGISCLRTSFSSFKILRAVSWRSQQSHLHLNARILCLDSNKKLQDVLEEFCGATSTYKFNQDDVSRRSSDCCWDECDENIFLLLLRILTSRAFKNFSIYFWTARPQASSRNTSFCLFYDPINPR